MNSVQIHLALTHVPVILSLAGFAMLAVAIIIKNTTITSTSYILILISGLTAIPVFLSGEGAEEAVENLPGVSESIIEKHEEVAKLVLISIAASGVLALAALFSSKWQAISRLFKIMVLLFSVISGALMIQTAHLGGQIRHSEIRSGAVQTFENETRIQNQDDD